MKRLVIIDGNYLAYRSYYASIKWSKDKETNAVWQFKKTLNHINKNFSINKIIAVFDSKEGSVYRKKLYKEYKANRTKMPDGLIKQMPLIKQMLEDQKISHYSRVGCEADDIIGIISNKLLNKYDKIYILTSDKDMFQLMTKNILIMRYLEKEWRILDKKYVKSRYGINPNQFSDYLALVGDKGDNIPGAIPGIGEKKAVILLNRYKNVDNILKLNKFRKFRDVLILNKKLTTIRTV